MLPKIVILSCWKIGNDIKLKYMLKYVKYCDVTSKVPFFSNITLNELLINHYLANG